jgi:hypothetical protein
MKIVKRQPLFILVIGTNGTGKTTLVLNDFVAKYKNKVLIVDADGMEQKWQQFPLIEPQQISNPTHRITRVLMQDEKTTIENISNFTNGLVVLDDCRVYISNRLEKPFRRLFIRRKQFCQDQIAVAHGISEIPSTFWTYATHLILFKTTDSYLRQSSKDNIPRAKIDDINNAINFLNNQNDIHKSFTIPLR